MNPPPPSTASASRPISPLRSRRHALRLGRRRLVDEQRSVGILRILRDDDIRLEHALPVTHVQSVDLSRAVLSGGIFPLIETVAAALAQLLVAIPLDLPLEPTAIVVPGIKPRRRGRTAPAAPRRDEPSVEAGLTLEHSRIR